MTPPTSGVRIEALLEHSDWLRELARRLVRDSDEADDLTQRTWLAALERPPFQLASARQWLASVMRNFARQDRRAGARRSEREEHVARREALPSTLDVLARASLERRVADAVLELDEPYRTTILLRFFDGLAPREVARAQGVPVDTVRTRTARGLEQLRARLDAGFEGGREAWSALVCTWLVPKGSVAAPLGVALLMNLKVKLAVLALSLVAAVAVWIGTRDSAAADEPSSVVGASAPTSAPEVQSTPVSAQVSTERQDVAPVTSAPSASQAQPAVAAPAPPRQRGHVIDERERAVSGVRVVLEGTSSAVLTGSDGAFELEGGFGRLIVDDERWTTLYAGAARDAGSAAEVVLVVAPRVRFGGRVTDVDNAPLAGVRIAIELPEAFRTKFSSVLDRSEKLMWKTESAADGTYAFDEAPGIVGAELTASLDGFVPDREPLIGVAQGDVWLTLLAPGLDANVLRGRVVDARGAPVEDARVAFGIDTVESDENGGFAFRKDDPESLGKRFGVAPTWLSAVKRGQLPARIEPELVNGEPVWPDFVVLRLGATPLEIRGRVVDAASEPVAGVRVWVANTTLFGAVDVDAEPTSVENFLAGDAAFWHFARTGDDGTFVLDGLLDQDYELGALDEDNLLRAHQGPVAAGSTGVELVLPTDQLYPRVAGRLVSRAGKPIAGATIGLMCDAFQSRLHGEIVGTSHASAMRTTTDAAGRFEFEGVPKSLVYLRIDGDELLPLEYGRYVEGDPRFAHTTVKELPKDRIESLEIVVALRCHVQVEVDDPTLADEFAVLDDAGTPLEISVFEGRGRRDGERSPILEGRSHTTGAPDFGTTLVLYKKGVEVARRPITLAPDAVQTVRF